MTTQSIIVYRNPLEQAFWEGTMSGQFFPVFAGMLVGLVVVLVTARFTERFRWSRRGAFSRWVGDYGSVVAGGATWIAVTWFLWI